MKGAEVSLQEHLMAVIDGNDRRYAERFDAQENAVKAALDAAALAVNKAEEATEKRLEGMNEFREQARDRDVAFLTKVEFDGYRNGVEQRMRWLVGMLVTVSLAVFGYVVTR